MGTSPIPGANSMQNAVVDVRGANDTAASSSSSHVVKPLPWDVWDVCAMLGAYMYGTANK